MSIGVPCAALQAMIWKLVGDPARGGGIHHVLVVYGTLFLAWLVIGRTLNKILPGRSPELLMEVPPYKLPYLQAVFKKLWMRILGFLREALPIVLLTVLVVNILDLLGIFKIVAAAFSPIMASLLGLPEEAFMAIVIGVLRKDVAMGILGTMDLAILAAVDAST